MHHLNAKLLGAIEKSNLENKLLRQHVSSFLNCKNVKGKKSVIPTGDVVSTEHTSLNQTENMSDTVKDIYCQLYLTLCQMSPI